MALNAYLTMVGQKTGAIKGSVTQKGREGTIMVIGCSQSIISPRDAASGLPSGKRMHKPFVITKETDMASPLLYNLMVNNENISTWSLKFFRSAATGATTTGTETNFYTIDMVNATICSVDFRMANNRVPELMKFAEYEEVGFVYQKITWTWTTGGVMASDDWETPV